MANNPFNQGGWDPFGELPPATVNPVTATPPRTPEQPAGSIRPSRAAPQPPKPASNPFTADAFTSTALSTVSKQQDPFDLLSGATIPPQASSNTTGAAGSNTGRYTQPQQAFYTSPPSYNQAVWLSSAPAAADAGLLPPPAYEEAIGVCQLPPPQQQQQQPTWQQQAPASPAQQQPGPSLVPRRPAPSPRQALGHSAQAAHGHVPAHAALGAAQVSNAAAVTPGTGVITSDDLDWLRTATQPCISSQQHQQGLQQDFAGLQVSVASSKCSSSGASEGGVLSNTYASIGNVGAAPRAVICNSQQVLQRNLHAQIRLAPLTLKTATTLKMVIASHGSLFAGPAGDAGRILQWSPSGIGNTLPRGAKATAREDHDSAASAELTPGHHNPAAAVAGAAAAAVSSGSKSGSKVSCMLVSHGPGWLWCGCTDGQIHCWCLDPAGGPARWLHSWTAHNGKVKALAVSPTGRLFTGSSNGAMKMWSYGCPAYADPSTPRQLRQLRKFDSRSTASSPHSKVIAMAVSSSGRVLWSVGKNTINIWSTHNGKYLGTVDDSPEVGLSNVLAARGGYTPATALQGCIVNSGDINSKTGLDPALLDTLFEHPAAELVAEQDASQDNEKDAATVALNAAVKGAAKASKLLNKLGNRIAAKIMEENQASSSDADASDGNGPGGGSSSHDAPFVASRGAGAAVAGPADKQQRYGAIKKLAAAADGSMWLSYKKGLLEKYSEGGKLVWSSCSTAASMTQTFNLAGITALAAVGSNIWVGDQSGTFWVLSAGTCEVFRSCKAHVFPVKSIAAAGHVVYTLGKSGSIRAWPAGQPSSAVTTTWQQQVAGCLRERKLQVLAGTWNVNETKPSRAGLQMWLGDRAKAADMVVLGLQEVEMGTGSVALDVVYHNLAKVRLEAGTQAAQAWAAAVSDVLTSKGDFKRVGLRQMSGVLVLVYARSALEPYIGEVATASVACGVMGYGGNKGAVAISFSLFRRRVVVVSSHFAAHQDKVDARNADYTKIVRHLHFHNVPTDKPQQQQQYEASDTIVPDSEGSSYPQKQQQQLGRAAGIQAFISKQQRKCIESGVDSLNGGSPKRGSRATAATDNSVAAASASSGSNGLDEDWGAGMRDAELLVWVGDFNYRIDSPTGFIPDRSDLEKWPLNAQLYQYVHKLISARQLEHLLAGDQCCKEMARGVIFHALAEGPINFLPTYKFEKGRESNSMQPFYDQGEKKMIPAWTDRILFRGSDAQRSALAMNPAGQPANVRVALASAQCYSSVMEVNDSDHKPVYAVLDVLLPVYDQQQQRKHSLEQLWLLAADNGSSGGNSSTFGRQSSEQGLVLLQIQPQRLVLQGSYVPNEIQIHNPCSTANCYFAVQGVGRSAALPTWLEVAPAAGIVPAGGTVRLRVQGNKAQWLSGSTECEIGIVGCLEGSLDSSCWPAASSSQAQLVSVMLN